MPFNGSGTFSPYTPGNPVVTGTTISSSAHNATVTDLAAGLTNAVTRDGQSPATANIPMGNNKLTGLAAAAANGDAVRYEQVGTLALAQGVAASGANADITSLGAATGVTASERDNSTKLATTAYVDRAGVPVGTIIAYAGPTIPAGYLVLPITATNISRTTYAALFGAIGTYFGVGDGSTTFGMPYVIDDGTIVHSPGAYGTVTTGALLAHVHTVNVTTEMAAGSNDGAARNSGTGLHTNNTSSVGGSGNLPAGARARFAIKY